MPNGIFTQRMSMRTGDRMKNRFGLGCRFCRVLLSFLFISYSVSVHAIDNPDAPDYIGEFQNRAQVYERAIQQAAQTTLDYVEAYAAYERFLDQELNNAYGQLMTHLDKALRQALRNSQRKWLEYRDAEFDFIAANWMPENFGSSSAISRGDYRTTLIRDRVMLLLNYLQNY